MTRMSRKMGIPSLLLHAEVSSSMTFIDKGT